MEHNKGSLIRAFFFRVNKYPSRDINKKLHSVYLVNKINIYPYFLF